MRKRPAVITIAGSDSSGGAGLQADLKTFTSLGVYGATVITGLTAQNTTGVKKVLEVPTDFVEAQFDAILEDFEVKYAKTGMLASTKIIEAVKRKVKEYGINLILDPVMISKAGSPLTTEDITTSLLDLAKESIIITPNSYEAEKLTGEKITDKDSLIKVANKLAKITGSNVVVKGGERLNGLDVAIINNDVIELPGKFVNTKNTHGSGDVFSASITAYLAKGYNLLDAVKLAKEFTTYALQYSLDMGKGIGPVDPFVYVEKLSEIGKGFSDLISAIDTIQKSLSSVLIKYLSPEEKGNIGYKTSYGDVISLSDGLSIDYDQLKINGMPRLNINNILTEVLSVSQGSVAMLVPLSIHVSKLIDKKLVKLNESGINGNGTIKGSFIVITANNFNELFDIFLRGERDDEQKKEEQQRSS